MTRKRKTHAGASLKDGLGVLLKPQPVAGDDYVRPANGYGLPAREQEDYYITEIYHNWLDECRKAKSFAPSKPDVVFHIAFKLGLEYAALNNQPETLKGSS